MHWSAHFPRYLSASNFLLGDVTKTMQYTRLFYRASKLLLASVVAASALTTGAAHAADVKAGKAKAGVCAGCHGLNGQSPQPIWPSIAGQGAPYIAKQLRAFKSGERVGAMMAPIVATLSETDMDNLAAWFSSLPAAQGTADASVAEAGKDLYRGGDAEKAIPACMSCHGPGGRGMSAAGFPAVAGQHAQYTITQLQAFASGARSNDPAQMMRQIAARMDAKSMRAVAEYMAGLR
jgi:cytochrome c553